RGYDVSIVDANEERFSQLGAGFSGLAVTGSPTDIRILENAGCANMDIAIVVTPKDNVNVMVAQMLKIEFDIEEVYVRVLDPSREAVFRKFGLRTICPTRFESDALFNLVTEDADDIDSLTIGTSSVQFICEKAEKHILGKNASELISHKNEMPFAVKKKNGQLVLCNDEDLIIEDGDRIVYAAVWGG
ncbi:MAG: NAD-binding protein, partial [Acutalibacteraceae bacterium]